MSTAKYEILLAEDSAADVMLVREALKQHGVACALHVVNDGAEAMAFIEEIDRNAEKRCLDLLLLDMHLPRHNGAEILNLLRSAERCDGTAVVVMSGSDAPADREVAEKHTVLRYFRKPSTLEQFMKLGGIVKEILAAKPGLEPFDGARPA